MEISLALTQGEAMRLSFDVVKVTDISTYKCTQ